ncbi:hypothetical protein AAF712_007554 [Marasmius tenuissimus]|uniref:Uncharacterized protein n=1 Tax=Marasmius tenuissimus TaxID=585030 RepID=A0ABR2ZUX5_9AGAR
MNGLPPLATSLTTPITKPQQLQHGFSVEESREKRLQRQQARFRDRGGKYQPQSRDTLLNILLKGGKSPTKDSRGSRSRSRSKSPAKSSSNKGGDGGVQSGASGVSSQAKSRRKSAKAAQEETAAGPSTARAVTKRNGRSKASKSTSTKQDNDDENGDSESTNVKLTEKRGRKASETTASKAKGKQRSGTEGGGDAEVPKAKRSRTVKKPVEQDVEDEEDDYKPKRKSTTQSRKAPARKKAPAKRGKAKSKVSDEDGEKEEVPAQAVDTTRKPKGRTQVKGAADNVGKTRGRAKGKAAVVDDTAENLQTEESHRTANASATMHEKRRIENAKTKSTYGALSDIEEEEEPISRTPPNSTGQGGETDVLNKPTRPLPAAEVSTATTASGRTVTATSGRKRKKGEAIQEAGTSTAATHSRKKPKLAERSKDIEHGQVEPSTIRHEDQNKTKLDEPSTAKRRNQSKVPPVDRPVNPKRAIGTKEPLETADTSSPSSGSRKRKLDDAQTDVLELVAKSKKGRKPPATKPTEPIQNEVSEPDAPVKKRMKTSTSETTHSDERLKTTSRKQKENSSSKPQPKKQATKKPTSKQRAKPRGPPKEVLEQIGRSKPHIEDGEPDELDFLS